MMRFFKSPYGVMAVVLCMYVIKVACKLSIGMHINSPMIEGDGWHNAADIFEALLVIATIWFARLPPSDTYPFGRKMVESVFSVLVGISLTGLAINLSYKSIDGLMAWYAGEPATLVMSPTIAWIVLLVTGGSSALSFIVSRYQIQVGKSSGHETLEADGEETRGDGLIELATFVGVAAEYLFHAPWLEYLFALFIVWFMSSTAFGLIKRGASAILMLSLGEKCEMLIEESILDIPGIESVEQLKTFRVGSKAIVILKLASVFPTRTQRLLKEAVADEVWPILENEEFSDAEFFIRFDPPVMEEFRQALLLAGRSVARDLSEVTAVVVMDARGDAYVRMRLYTVPDLPHSEAAHLVEEGSSEAWILQLIADKRVAEMIMRKVLPGELPAGFFHSLKGLNVVYGTSSNPSVYGIPMEGLVEVS